jgi:Flp pilus assembly protein TadD
MSDAVKTKRLNMQIGQKTSPNMAKKTTAQQWWILAGILLLGMLLRVAYLRVLVKEPDFAFPIGDMLFHDYWARGLVTGHWTAPEGILTPQIPKIPFLRSPGYPYFLALIYWAFGTNYIAPRIVQMGLGLVSVALAFLLGRSLFGRITGFIFAAFMATYWAFIYFEGELHYPALLIFLILAFINVLKLWAEKFTYPRVAGAGVLIGICVLTSPSMFLLLPVILAWGWWVARRRKQQKHYALIGLVFVVAAAMVIAPATIRNYIAADDFVLISCNDGLPIYCANNEVADVVNSIFPGSEKLTGGLSWGWMTYPSIVQGVQREQGRPMKYSEVSSYFARKALDYIRKHPRRALRLVGIKASLFWGPLEVTDNKEVYCDRENSAVLRYSPSFSVFLALCIVGSGLAFFDLRAARKGKDAAVSQVTRQIEICVLIFPFVATYFISFLPVMASARYRVPIIPFILLFGAYAISRVGQFIRSWDWRKLAVCGCIGVALYLQVSKPVLAYLPSRAKWHFCRGLAYQQSGKFDEAVAEYQEAVRLRPDFNMALMNLASVLSKQGKYSDSLVPARTMVQLNPDSAVAHVVLGCLLLETGHTDDGFKHLIKAVNLAPNSFDAHFNLGVAWAKKGEFDKAVKCFEHARDLQPDNPIVHRMLMESLAAQGRTEREMSELGEVLRLKRGDTEDQEILRTPTKQQKLEK